MSSVFGLTCRFAEDRLTGFEGIGCVERLEIALHLALEKRGDPRLEIGMRLVDQGVDGVLAEDRVEELAAEGRGAAVLYAVAVLGEHDDHEGDSDAVDTEGEELRRHALVGALDAYELKYGLTPVVDHPLGLDPELKGCSVEATCVGDQRASGLGLAPGAGCRLRGRLGLLDDQHRHAGLDGVDDLLGACALAGHAVDESVSDATDLLLDGSQQLAGA